MHQPLPMSAIWRTAEIDVQRVLRVIGSYRVRGAVAGTRNLVIYVVRLGCTEHHTVDLRDDAADLCDCADHTFRQSLCVHVIAALLWRNDERVLRAVGVAMRDAWLDRAPEPPTPQYRNGVRVS
jgi:hypothetical protein